MTRFRLAALSAFALMISTGPGARALPDLDLPAIPVDGEGKVIDCPDFFTPTVELVQVPYISGYPIVGFTVKISGEQVKFHGSGATACGIPDFIAPIPSFTWDLFSSPAGSLTDLTQKTTLAPLLPLDAAGDYVVRLTVCPGGCLVPVPGGHWAPVSFAGATIDVPIQARDSAPLGPETMPAVVPSTETPYSEPAPYCSFLAGFGAKQWWANEQIETPEQYKRLEGLVRHSRVSRKDDFLNHHAQDTNYHITPDPKYRYLLFDDPDSPFVEPIEVEWERDSIPERYRPTVGDRVSIFGIWDTDCNHDKPEIHPPVGIAVHRPRPIRIPNERTFAEFGGENAGRRIYVPGIITDIWFNTRGGEMMECSTDTGLANADLVVQPGGNLAPGCVPPLSIRRSFDFDIFLPRNPRTTMAQAGIDVPPVPLYIQRDPVTGGPEPVIELRRDPASEIDYLHVTIDLSDYVGTTYAYRIATGWVLPAADNWGLTRYKLRLHRLNVTNDGDGTGRGAGDWRLWLNTNNATNIGFPRQEWVPIINYDVHGVVDFGGRPWETDASTADRSLGPDLLRYPPPESTLLPGPRDYGILFHTTGYEADTVTDDDAGTVLESHVVPGTTYVVQNQCAPSIDFHGLLYSGCVEYRAVFEALPGTPLEPAVVDPEAQAVASQYILRCGSTVPGNDDVGVCGGNLRDLVLAPPIEVTRILPEDVPLPPGSAPLEYTEFAAFEPGEREATMLTEITMTDFYRGILRAQKSDPALADRLLARLHDGFAERLADPEIGEEAILDAQIVKASLPPELWTRYFADLPAPRPDPDASQAKFTGAGSLDSPAGKVRLRSMVLHCAGLVTPNSLSVLWGQNRFDLDLVLGATCTDEAGTIRGIQTQRGTGVGRFNGLPGVIIEWTLVDRGEPATNDTASITLRSADDGAILFAVAGRITQGNLQGGRGYGRDRAPDRMPAMGTKPGPGAVEPARSGSGPGI